MHDSFFASTVPLTGKLYRKRRSGIVIAVKNEAFPRSSVSSTIFELWRELLNSDEVLIAVLILCVYKRMNKQTWDEKSYYRPLYTAREPRSHQLYHIETQSNND